MTSSTGVRFQQQSCLITSNLTRVKAPVLLEKGEAGFPKASVVNVSQVITVNKSELVGRIGKLSAGAASDISAGLHLLFDRL
jgi:mRNA interferase MazF